MKTLQLGVIILGVWVGWIGAVGSADASSFSVQTPYVIYGHVYYENGTPVKNAFVNVSDARTGEYIQNVTDDNGYYQIDLANLPSGYSNGDKIYVNVTISNYFGYNTTVVDTSDPYEEVNVIIYHNVPEFSGFFSLLLLLFAVVVRKTIRGGMK